MDSVNMKNRIKGKPEFINLEETADGTVYMRWKLTPGAQKYIVEKFNREKAAYEKIATLTAEVNEFIDEDVSPSSVYRYRIQARRKNSPDETIIKRGVATSVAVSSQSIVTISDVIHEQFGRAVIKWEKDEDADGYRVNRRHSLVSDTLPLAYVEGQKLSYTDKSEVSGQIYFYSVQSYRHCEDDEIVYSKNSEERMVVNLNETQILSMRKSAGKKVAFTVRVTAGIDSYVLYKSSEENGEYKEVCRTKSGTDIVLNDKGESGERGVYYVIKCAKFYEGKEYLSYGTKPTFVKY